MKVADVIFSSNMQSNCQSFSLSKSNLAFICGKQLLKDFYRTIKHLSET